jgi:hypothetical protein
VIRHKRIAPPKDEAGAIAPMDAAPAAQR